MPVREPLVKPYSSQKELIAEAAPKARGFTSKKGFRNKELTEREREKNRSKSSVRAKVEHAFLRQRSVPC